MDRLDGIKDNMGILQDERQALGITAKQWESFEPKLVIGWCLHAMATAKTGDQQMALEQEGREAIGTVRAQAAAEEPAARSNMNVLRQVPWHSPLLSSLLKPVEDAYQQPWKMITKNKRVTPHGKQCMTANALIKLLKNDGKFQSDMDNLSEELGSMLMNVKHARESYSDEDEDVDMEG